MARRMRSTQPLLYQQQEDSGDLSGVWVRLVAPAAVNVALLAAGAATHRLWGDSPGLPWVTAVMAPMVACLVWMTWALCRNRSSEVTRWHAAVSTGLAGVWLLVATVTGPTAPVVLDAWLLVGMGLAVSWSIRLMVKAGRRDQAEAGDLTPRKAAKALMHSLGLDAELRPDRITPHQISGQLELTTGRTTVEQVQKAAPMLATAAGLPPGGVRISGDPNNAARAEFSFTLRDVLSNPIPWPGPSAVGGTVFDPVPMGLYDDGAVAMKTLADHAGAKHELVQGTTGSGKSSGAMVNICELIPRREVSIFVVDAAKGIQTFREAAPGLALFLTTNAAAQKFMRRFMTVIKARTEYLGAHGYKEWRPGCGLNFLEVLIEEAGVLFTVLPDEDLKNVAKTARSAGIRITASLQRPSHDEIDTTMRAQFNTISCFGMAADDSVCLLPDVVLEAGADPEQWGDRQPGCAYITGTNISVARAATPLRHFKVEPDQMAAVAAHYGPLMTPLDAVTARALGDVWSKRIPPMQVVADATARAVGGPVTSPRPAALTSDQDQDQEDRVEDATVSPDEMELSVEDPAPDLDVDPDDELEPLVEDLRIGGDPVAEVPTGEARALVAARIAELEAAGRGELRVPDLSDLVQARIRSRGWFHKELQRLVKVGRLEVRDSDAAGVYRIVPLDQAGDVDDLAEDQDEDDGVAA